MAVQAQWYSDNIGFPVCGSQDWFDINGCGSAAGGGDAVAGGGVNQFCFGRQQKPQLHHQQQQLLKLQNQQPKNQSIFINNNNNNESIIFAKNLAFQVEKQRLEIDQFFRSQNERLKTLLLEQSKHQVAAFIKKIEAKACFLLRQKDEELQKATNKTMELQNLLTKLAMENQAWQRVAQENEAMVSSLNNRLEQLQTASCCFNNNGAGAEDAESCCDEVNNRDHFTVGGEQTKTTTPTMVCKCCNSRSTCVLFLPCRHLCSCKDCAAFLDTCPVCGSEKKASLEALIS